MVTDGNGRIIEDIQNSPLARVLLEVLSERRRQDRKWGEQNHNPMEWIGVLGEEFGEAASEAVKGYFSETLLLQGAYDRYREELVQVAAVAVAAIECIDRGDWRKCEPWRKKE